MSANSFEPDAHVSHDVDSIMLRHSGKERQKCGPTSASALPPARPAVSCVLRKDLNKVLPKSSDGKHVSFRTCSGWKGQCRLGGPNYVARAGWPRYMGPSLQQEQAVKKTCCGRHDLFVNFTEKVLRFRPAYPWCRSPQMERKVQTKALMKA